MQHPSPGPGDQSQYTVSGLPFALSGSGSQRIDFPYLTQWICVRSNAGTSVVAFTQQGFTSGYTFSIPAAGSSQVLPLRIKTLFVSGAGFEVIAGLTMIEPRMWPTLTAAAAPGALGPYVGSDSFGYVPGL